MCLTSHLQYDTRVLLCCCWWSCVPVVSSLTQSSHVLVMVKSCTRMFEDGYQGCHTRSSQFLGGCKSFCREDESCSSLPLTNCCGGYPTINCLLIIYKFIYLKRSFIGGIDPTFTWFSTSFLASIIFLNQAQLNHFSFYNFELIIINNPLDLIFFCKTFLELFFFKVLSTELMK